MTVTPRLARQQVDVRWHGAPGPAGPPGPEGPQGPQGDPGTSPAGPSSGGGEEYYERVRTPSFMGAIGGGTVQFPESPSGAWSLDGARLVPVRAGMFHIMASCNTSFIAESEWAPSAGSPFNYRLVWWQGDGGIATVTFGAFTWGINSSAHTVNWIASIVTTTYLDPAVINEVGLFLNYLDDFHPAGLLLPHDITVCYQGTPE